MKRRKFYTVIFILVLLSIPASCFSGEWTVTQVPVAQDIELRAVWGSADDNVYAVGTSGAILHYDGSAWSAMNSPTARGLNGIWGRSGNDIFAVGSAYDHITHYYTPTIIHYNGTTWNKMSARTTNDFSSVWGTSGDDLFVAGTGPFNITHFDGTCWSYLYYPEYIFWIYAVWGVNSSDVYAVGMQGTILHYDGSVLTAMASGTTHELLGIWGSAGSDIFAVGASGSILHYNGTAWSSMSSGTANDLYGVWGSSGSDVFAVGAQGTILHYDGSIWTVMSSGTGKGLYGIWGGSGGDVFAVGQGGTILHYSEDPPVTTTTSSGITSTTTTSVPPTTTTTVPALPGEWTVEPPHQQTSALTNVWGSSASDVFAVGHNGTILRRAGNSWHGMTSGTANDLYGIWGSSARDVFVVGDQGTILHYDGIAWSPMECNAADYDLLAVWGSSPDDVFVIGTSPGYYSNSDGIILHYDGTIWITMATNWHLRSVWGTSGNDVFATGRYEPVIHYDGSAWTEITECPMGYDILWGTSSDSVYVSRCWGEIANYDGECWSAMIELPLECSVIWGSSDTDLFIVGKPTGYLDSEGTWIPNGPNVYHYDGNTWSPVDTGTLEALHSIWGSSATNVFAVGANGLILHYSVDVDSDNDNVPDSGDNCPQKPNSPVLGTCMPGSDKAGATCTSDADCAAGCSTNGKCSMNQEDTDHDGWGDVCDNCPANCNLQQLDADQDGNGDVCDSSLGCGGCTGVQCEQECYPYTI